jgi:hypothetical protein
VKTYHKPIDRGPSPENSLALPTERKRLLLASRLRALQVQLRHGRDVHAADITRLARYCADASAK